MVFVWSNLTDGDPNFTLSQVALNDTIMVFAFAPIVGLLLGLSAITVPWQTLFLSVVLYIVVPVIVAQLWRRALLSRGGAAALAATLRRLQPVSLVSLLATLVLLFGFQGEQIVKQPLVIALLDVSPPPSSGWPRRYVSRSTAPSTNSIVKNHRSPSPTSSYSGTRCGWRISLRLLNSCLNR